MKNIKTIKTLKTILITALVIISIVVFAISNKSYSASGAINLWDIPTDGGQYKDDTYFAISFAHLTNSNNIYCIQHDQHFPSRAFYMQVKYKIIINGENAKIYEADRLEPDKGSLVKETNGYFNNLLAAIVSEEETQLGYGPQASKYNESQIALYYYWGNWLKESGCNEYMLDSGGNYTIVEEEGQSKVSQIMEKYRNYASEYLYNATIYYMTPVFNSVQRLLLVERGERTDLNIDIPVEKIWLDGENKFNTRTEITVELLANDKPTGQKLTLNASNNWRGKFLDLNIKDENGKEIKYTTNEVDTPKEYTSSTSESAKDGFIITNTLLTEVKVVKQWEDKDNIDEYRPSSLKVTLYSNGTSTGKTVTLDEKNNWTATFEKLNKYDKNGEEINYTVEEEKVENYEKPEYSKVEDSKNGYITWTITNKHTPYYDGYVEISGKVWVDKEGGKGNNINGVFGDEKDSLLEGITVRLKYIDENGKHQLFNPSLSSVYETKTNSKGEYKIVVNYDNTQNVYKLYEDVATVKKKLETAYVEFEYDGMKYTTVAKTDDGVNTSKAKENESQRNTFDSKYSTVTSSTNPETWTDKNITAATNKVTSYKYDNDENREVVVKYCNGNGTYIRTNPAGAWKDILPGKDNLACNTGKGHELRKYEITVQKIPNINLGLFEREQPDVAIFSDISKVEVEMNNQRYTYLYGVRSDKYKPEDTNYIQTKFQNKDIYTYRRPVNAADIAYLKEVNKNAMEVYVTYEITLGNLSNTLTTLINSIANSYDSNYKINNSDIIYGKMDDNGNITGTALQESQISAPTSKDGYSEIVLSGLGIEIRADQGESENKLYLRYQIDQEKLPELFNENTPPLNNATEILSYTTKYGEKTLYAEQRTGGDRTNKPYAGYDYNSHPGNANIKLIDNGDGVRLYSTDASGNIIPTDKVEDDTDIAPAFILCKDNEPKILSGTVWEDTDQNTADNERLGDGKKSDTEKAVANAKVELYKVNDDGTSTLANLYKIDQETGKISGKPAVTYSNNEGYYSFGSKDDGYGVVTDKYFIKFVYGEGIDNSTSSTIDNVSINGRDYKSTIISSETELYNMFKGTSSSEEWHLNIDKGYSIAVDEIEQRVAIEDLQYSNFDNAINMTAYSKPFKMQVEFNPNEVKKTSVLEDGKTVKGGSELLKNELNVFDFGIIERAREDIYVQKTVNYLKVILANGQVLIEGNPIEQNLNYVKAIGYKQKINSSKEAREALEKQMLIEMDKELMQGAQLEVRYAINVVNDSEQDYDYYVDGKIKTEYYYFGTNDLDKSPIITSSVNYLVDYVDSDFVYTWENADNWSKVTSKELGEEGKELVNDKTLAALDSGKYIAYVTTQFSEVAPGEKSHTEYATAKKLLTSKDENVYENHIEILKIDAKVARTMSEKDKNGTPVLKEYKPGNYVPSKASRFTDSDINSNNPGRHEQDDDIAKIIITPPTGETSSITTYVITALVELMIVCAGIIYIKKKRLIK